ncbi:unnamed protein product [Tilletia controversa]|nr:hypothetical protein CF328_g1628 [Tilletia controversa]CAD6934714.1 unnamed protein product [Tilletia controversa]CAD6936269.1 unnamed protein product [Tilletia controversa]
MGGHTSPSSRQFEDFEKQPGLQGHPFLSGNYAPQQREQPLTPCQLIHGQVPLELAGSQYVRNGGNASEHFDEDRDAHWFDADGMLSGVYFKRGEDGLVIVPNFVNRFILTDIHLTTSSNARRAILPSIATLIDPTVSLASLMLKIMRAVILVFATWIPFLWTGSLAAWKDGGGKVKRISVANTSIWWHDRKALAGCESGPPIQIRLPELDTSQWWLGQGTDAERPTKTWAAGPGLLKHFREYTTAHPKVDPVSGDLILYHMCFVAPFLRISVIPSRDATEVHASGIMTSKHESKPLLGVTVPGLNQPKLMHDFGCTRTRTVILDLPLSLDPRNLLKGRPVMHYDAKQVGRLGIFPRRSPDQVQWLDTREAFCVYHTANAWDDDFLDAEQPPAVNLLACRLNSATLAYVAGNVPPPPHVLPATQQREKCQLYYWRVEGGPAVERPLPFDAPGLLAKARPVLHPLGGEGSQPPSYHASASLGLNSVILDGDVTPPLSPPPNYSDVSRAHSPSRIPSVPTEDANTSRVPPRQLSIACEFALSEIPFEFPTLNRSRQMQSADYIYGTSTRASGLDSRLQKVGTGAAKIDCLVKVHANKLVARGLEEWKAGSQRLRNGAAVDERGISDILLDQERHPSADNHIQVFPMPTGWYAQEATFVSRAAPIAEDDGFLLFYAFDELIGLDPSTGRCLPDAKSELWILDARDMRTLVCRIGLPQRVPYGLHGEWFDEAKIASQEMVPTVNQLEEDATRQRNEETRRRRRQTQAGATAAIEKEKEPLLPRSPELRRRYRRPAGDVVSPVDSAASPSDFPRAQGRFSRTSWALRNAVESWLN